MRELCGDLVNVLLGALATSKQRRRRHDTDLTDDRRMDRLLRLSRLIPFPAELLALGHRLLLPLLHLALVSILIAALGGKIPDLLLDAQDAVLSLNHDLESAFQPGHRGEETLPRLSILSERWIGPHPRQ